MPNYIDGFVFPIRIDHVEQYQMVAGTVAKIYREHGAIDYLEFIGDDLKRTGTRPFPELLTLKDGETVVFGWIVFESRESRDAVNKLVESDHRMTELVAPLLDPDNPVFDPMRMAYGGFHPLVRVSADDSV